MTADEIATALRARGFAVESGQFHERRGKSLPALTVDGVRLVLEGKYLEATEGYLPCVSVGAKSARGQRRAIDAVVELVVTAAERARRNAEHEAAAARQRARIDKAKALSTSDITVVANYGRDAGYSVRICFEVSDAEVESLVARLRAALAAVEHKP